MKLIGWGRGKQNPDWASMEQRIIELVQEHHRLLGIPLYEPLSIDMERLLHDGKEEFYESN